MTHAQDKHRITQSTLKSEELNRENLKNPILINKDGLDGIGGDRTEEGNFHSDVDDSTDVMDCSQGAGWGSSLNH